MSATELESPAQSAAYRPSRLADTAVKIKQQSIQALKEAEIEEKRLNTLNEEHQLAKQREDNAWELTRRIQQNEQQVKQQKQALKAKQSETEKEKQAELELRRQQRALAETDVQRKKQLILQRKQLLVQEQRKEMNYLKCYNYQAKQYEAMQLQERKEYISQDIKNAQNKVLEEKFRRANEVRIKNLEEAVELAQKAENAFSQIESMRQEENERKLEIERAEGGTLRAQEALKRTVE